MSIPSLERTCNNCSKKLDCDEYWPNSICLAHRYDDHTMEVKKHGYDQYDKTKHSNIRYKHRP